MPQKREGFTLAQKRTAFAFFFVTMRGVHPSLLIGSQLRALLSTQCIGSAFRSGRFRVGNTQCVDRSNAVREDARQQCETQCAWLMMDAFGVAESRTLRRGGGEVAGRSPSTTTPKVRIRDAASVRVDHASPAQAQSAAPVRAPPRQSRTSRECGPTAT